MTGFLQTDKIGQPDFGFVGQFFFNDVFG